MFRHAFYQQTVATTLLEPLHWNGFFHAHGIRPMEGDSTVIIFDPTGRAV